MFLRQGLLEGSRVHQVPGTLLSPPLQLWEEVCFSQALRIKVDPPSYVASTLQTELPPWLGDFLFFFCKLPLTLV